MSDHSLRTVVVDTFRAPRWVHHTVKIVTGALFVFALTFATAPPIACAISLAWFLSFRLEYWFQHWQERFFKPDLWCDTALHCVAMAWWVPDPYRVPFVVVCVFAYCATYPDASP